MKIKKTVRKALNPIPVATVPARIHPRTALWFEQREQCWVCKHCQAAGESLVCAVASRRANVNHNCITTREEGNVCGPDAKLFELNEDSV